MLSKILLLIVFIIAEIFPLVSQAKSEKVHFCLEDSSRSTDCTKESSGQHDVATEIDKKFKIFKTYIGSYTTDGDYTKLNYFSSLEDCRKAGESIFSSNKKRLKLEAELKATADKLKGPLLKEGTEKFFYTTYCNDSGIQGGAPKSCEQTKGSILIAKGDEDDFYRNKKIPTLIRMTKGFGDCGLSKGAGAYCGMQIVYFSKKSACEEAYKKDLSEYKSQKSNTENQAFSESCDRFTNND